ncbi:hypothetical protein [Sphingomonas sanguinis]|uniref:Uncharacterized protein n=1 Tax=Sphingomonas sanguinis TaxID=33051 RepID=A0A147J7K5_9SPHN|nr:hypothetical protein [Sphingomonas sanguinis]KTW12098.1 hypothetical protein NS258_10840 [Sphingomonas sanguinis]
MFQLSVFKPIDWCTSSLEVWSDDRLVAEVFARADGVRRLYVSNEIAERGIEWNALIDAAPKITAMLDAADAERLANGS